MKKCAYCDKEKKLTKEHIWPKCIINRMPELEAKYLDSRKIFIPSELVISDVCSDCNNVKLSTLDSYVCKLYDKYFKTYIENKNSFILEYDYELLLRALLKITYNSSRTLKKDENYFIEFRDFILNGNKSYENIILKLDIILPTMIDGVKIYPKSARCGILDIGFNSNNFILRMISINSYYFYIIISKNEFISNDVIREYQEVFNRIPGTIIHPYQQSTEILICSNSNTYSAHEDFIVRTQKEFKEYKDRKNN